MSCREEEEGNDVDDSQPIEEQLDALADRLDSYRLPAPAGRLRELRAAVAEGINADAWSEADLRALIDPEAIAERVRGERVRDHVVEVLELLRNTLVLAPLVVTWYGIWKAGEAYRSLSVEATRQPFLYLWQRGFGNGTITLSTIAAIDFAVLLVVITLSLVASFLSASRRDQRSAIAEEIRLELTHLLGDASLVLIARRQRQPTTFVGDFRTTADRYLGMIHEEHDRLAGLTSQRVKELEDLSIFTERLQQTVDTMLSGMSEMIGTMGMLMTAVTAEAARIEYAASTLATHVDTLNRNVTNLTMPHDLLTVSGRDLVRER